MRPQRRALVIGWLGGVGQGVMGLLERHPVGRTLRTQYDALVLVDADEPANAIVPTGATVLEPTQLELTADLRELIEEHAITTVVQLGSIDTLSCLPVVAKAGADLLATSVEQWPDEEVDRNADSSRALRVGQRLWPDRRPATARGSHLIGAGMNPGLVHTLIPAAMVRFAAATGVAPAELDLAGITLTEQDTTTTPSADPDAFASTWSPRGCIDALFEPRASIVRQGVPVELDHEPTQQLYRTRCGDRLIEGFAMPRQSLAALGYRYRDVELSYVYALPHAAASFLPLHRDEDPTSFRTQRMYPPHVQTVMGRDRFGVLLSSRRHGEYWLGWDTDCSVAAPLGPGATGLNVAAGVIAGWEQLGRVDGVHGMDEFDVGHVLETAQQILGPLLDHHDPSATWQPIEQRQV